MAFTSDGGTVWLETETVPFMTEGKSQESKDDIRKEYGRFGLVLSFNVFNYSTKKKSFNLLINP